MESPGWKVVAETLASVRHAPRGDVPNPLSAPAPQST
jgi:hypothetical protein